MNDAQITARALMDIGAAYYNADSPFRFTSGVISPVYVDCRKLISFPKQRDIILNLAVKKIRKLNLDSVDYIAGGETAGIPYAAFLAEKLILPMIYVRKKPKGFGKQHQIEGELKPDSRVLLVEDLLFDSGSKMNFKAAIEAAQASVAYLICIFSYGFKPAKERLAEAGLDYLALTDWPTLLVEAEKTGYFDSEQVKITRDFLQNPTEWAKNRHS